MLPLIKKLVQTAPLIHTGSNLESVFKRIKYCARGLAFASENRIWFDLLETPQLAMLTRTHPCLYHKLQRPYLNCKLTTRERLISLQEHYRFVATQFTPVMMHRVYSDAGMFLAALPPVESGNYELRLGFSHQQKEGDLVIRLVDQGTGAALFTLAFSITRFDNVCREIFIGGLQGNQAVNGKDTIITLTRGWHGLRPKALLLIALQQLAEVWGISRLRATSDEAHIYRHWQKRRELASCYNEWWLESGGTLAADGIFELPPRFIPREISTLKANKRPVYRRRYAMAEDLAIQMNSSLSGNNFHTPTVPAEKAAATPATTSLIRQPVTSDY